MNGYQGIVWLTSYELVHVIGAGDHCGTNDDDEASCEHPCSAPKMVRNLTSKQAAGNLSYRVHREDQSSTIVRSEKISADK